MNSTTNNIIQKGIGGAFIVAAILKLISIDEFEIYIYSFNIISFLLTTFVSRLIIAGEFVLGLFFILKINYKFTRRAILIILALFTLFLIYAAIFRNDDNCHCFGDLIELSPVESIIKNIVFILLLISQRTTDNGSSASSGTGQSTVNGQRSLLIATCTLLIIFIVSPPDSIYKMIYSTEKEVSSIDLFDVDCEKLTIDDGKLAIDEENLESEKLHFDSGRQLIVVVSSGCKYCRLGVKKLAMIVEREGMDYKDVDILIWGSKEGIANFIKETGTEEYAYWEIMPNEAIEITYGRFPIFILLEDRDIVKVGDFRDLDDDFFEISEKVNGLRTTDNSPWANS